uniref:Uncharacterized protein n=1 Tax=Timema douglasi TaxID=61478 RepID=A0A7R8VY72_TIMDO|nr:unnamed protein product [Timema douglasi]
MYILSTSYCGCPSRSEEDLRDCGWEGERRGVASQPIKVSFHANKNRWITETIDGASYRTERRPEKPAPALLHWKLIHEKVPWGLVLLLGGGFAMAEASKVSGLSHFLGVKLQALEVLPSFAILVIISTATTFLTEVSSNTAVANIVLPVLSEMEQFYNWDEYSLPRKVPWQGQHVECKRKTFFCWDSADNMSH